MADDDLLDDISRNCPNLTELDLAWDPGYEQKPDEYRSPQDDDFPYATPWGLLHLARRCPRLLKLAVAVDMRCAPPIHTCPNYELSTYAPPVHLSESAASALQEFNATGSLIGNTACVAGYLSLLFPRLSQFTHTFAPMQWDQHVSVLHSWIRRIRAQERASGERDGRRRREPYLDVEMEGTVGFNAPAGGLPLA